MTEVAHPLQEPAPWGGQGSVDSMSDEEVDWSIEKDRQSQHQSNLQGTHPSPTDDDHELDEEVEPKSVETDHADEASISNVRTPISDKDNGEGSDESSSSQSIGENDETGDKRKKYDTPYPRIKSPTGSPHHSVSSDGEEAPSGTQDKMQPQHDLSSGSQEDEDDDDDETFAMTEDQKLAMKELQEMRLDLGYTADEDPPEYDVAERVRQLNEELANDPTPVEDDRERSIKFKPVLVDLVAPPPDVSESEDDSNGDNTAAEDNSGVSNNTGSGDSGTGGRLTSGESGSEVNGGGSGGADGGDEKILVHRNGKFELTSAKDLSAEERQIYLGDDDQSEDSETTPRSTESAPEQSNDHEPRPPTHPRPRTANSSSSRRNGRGQDSGNNRRAKSAEPQLSENRDCEDFNYTSPYAMTSDERKRKAKEQREKDKQQKKEEDDKKKVEEKRKDDGESAFNAWLKKKKDQAAKNRQEKQKQKDNGEETKEEKESKNAFSEWQQEKQKQQKQQKQTEQKRLEEEEKEQAWATRTQKECDKAYKQWLRQKYRQWQMERNKDQQRTRVCRLMERRCRKSLALANAITQAQSFRYVDYYGYRS